MYFHGKFWDPREFVTVPLTPQLIAAYRKADYAVRGGPVLRIGEPSAELASLLARQGARTAAFVTGANPRGEPRSHAANEAAMAELRAAVSYSTLEGEGRDPQGGWGPEPSLLVLGIPRAEAEALGRRFEQNAIVFVGQGAAPELLLLRKMRLVLDTQVWVDWLVFGDASVCALRSSIDSGNAEVIVNERCRAELERVLAYPFNRAVDVAGCLEESDRISTRFEGTPTRKLPACRDPDDQKFLELADAANADCLVTRDRDLLRLKRRCAPWFSIVPPDAFRCS